MGGFPRIAQAKPALSRALVNPYYADGIGMAFYLVQKRWGRALLHLVAALRAGRWSWHFAGITRELRRPRMPEVPLASLCQGAAREAC